MQYNDINEAHFNDKMKCSIMALYEGATELAVDSRIVGTLGLCDDTRGSMHLMVFNVRQTVARATIYAYVCILWC